MKLHNIEGKSFVRIDFALSHVEPDVTAYKQRKPQLYPRELLLVAVNVPINKENVANYDEWATHLLDNDSNSQPELVLTPAGFEVVCQQLAYIQPTQAQTEEDNSEWDSGETSSEEETEKVAEKTTSKSPATSWDDFEDEVEGQPTEREEKANFEDNTEWES